MSTQTLLDLAQDPATTPFDYVVVGSGAGGGPLAARLAAQGRTVLVIEAGDDAALDDSVPGAPLRPIYSAPGYHAAATEDPRMSWGFSVRQYEDTALQARDSKYTAAKDPSQNGGLGAGGIFYPRASDIGGCTAHHAMIIVRPNDGDWDRIADLTGDDSWRSGNMQGYFARLESCQYYGVFQRFFRQTFGILYAVLHRVIAFLNPKWVLDTEGHGFSGWQPTNLIDPFLISKIAKSDRTFRGLLFSVIWARLGTMSERSILRRTLERFQIVQLLDPNARSAGLEQRARVALIPLATANGERKAVRERLLSVAQQHPDRLVILCRALATKVLFQAASAPGRAPQAVGIEVAEGARLYRACAGAGDLAKAPRKSFFARREIILSGGSFNTPQLLMLSGIGDREHLKAHNIFGLTAPNGSIASNVVHLPGVGRNLQDRYELSIISRANQEFSTLKGLTFNPDSTDDPARIQWEASRTGLYTTNGGAVAILAASQERQNLGLEPDLFIFGFSAAFRGYYWNWSRELLRRHKGDERDERDLWSWVILKAYTNNNGGTVRLLTDSPADTPEINFHSFSESPDAVARTDERALLSAIRMIRRLNAQVSELVEEIQPGDGLEEGSDALSAWVRTEAWGHHACGTCRIGSDVWTADTSTLRDAGAVLDSQFKVHGVERLRVVDASVYPHIPGYFLVAPTMMIGEKAADTLLADSAVYPRELELLESQAIHKRREVARLPPGSDERLPHDTFGRLPLDTVGLALSGGGIRSATFALGFLQALAAKGRLRRVDFISSVSGGGYIGCFLGRLFTRLTDEVADKVGRIEDLVADLRSPEIWWLRENANYLAGEGRSEMAADLSIVWRNLWSVHICLATLAFAALGALRAIGASADFSAALGVHPSLAAPWTISPWVWLIPAIFILAVAPAILAYWFSPLIGIVSGSVRTAIAWTTLALGLTLITTQRLSATFAAALIATGLAWLWHEIACRGLDIQDDAAGKRANKVASASTLVSNRLTRALTFSQGLLVWSIGWVLLDSMARSAAASNMAMIPISSGIMAMLLALAPLFRKPAKGILAQGSKKKRARKAKTTTFASLARRIALALLASALAAGWLFFVDLVVHVAFDRDAHAASTMVWLAAAISAAVGGAFTFVNRSSLQQVYAERLSRTFLGASSEARVRPYAGAVPVAVEDSHAGDDVIFCNYHPERAGGPLHLLNVCVNQTVDLVGARQLSADKGISMCLGPMGVSVGRRFHSVWSDANRGETPGLLNPLPTGSDPLSFHVLGRMDGQPADVETLRLGQWMAISGAAYTTGDGRLGSLPISWLLGLINLRIGYWWDSGIEAGDRPGRYPPVLWRRLLALPGLVFRAQSTILSEWRARFLGPAERYWYLSDGGHFEGTGLYELIRRRIPFMVGVDSSQDSSYLFDDLAELVRVARLDFDAEFHWMNRQQGATGWQAFDQSAQLFHGIPLVVKEWVNPDALGSIDTLSRHGPHVAALAAITYAGAPQPSSWLLYVKAVVPNDCPQDVRTYAEEHADFPNEPTVNQFFSDEQWECYRKIGESIGRQALHSLPRPPV
ncbi:MAG: GMC oxidoreductase [Steroidobacteraceae bacterium]